MVQFRSALLVQFLSALDALGGAEVGNEALDVDDGVRAAIEVTEGVNSSGVDSSGVDVEPDSGGTSCPPHAIKTANTNNTKDTAYLLFHLVPFVVGAITEDYRLCEDFNLCLHPESSFGESRFGGHR